MATRPRNVNPRNATGKDATLSVGNKDLPVTNFETSLNIETETSEFNDRLEGYTGYTTQHTEGSYDWDGVLVKNVAAVLRPDGTPRNHMRLMYSPPGITYHLKEMKLNGLDLSGPNDGKLENTVNFESDFIRWTRG